MFGWVHDPATQMLWWHSLPSLAQAVLFATRGCEHVPETHQSFVQLFESLVHAVWSGRFAWEHAPPWHCCK